MASTYTPLGIELQATGENAGTWGTKTNTNLQVIEQISGGYVAKSIAGGAQTTALTVSDGATGAELAHRMIEFTGTITGNQIVTIPLDVQNFYILRNSTSGTHTVQFKYASGSGDSFTFAATDKGDKIVFATANDGTNPDIDTLAIGTGISEVSEDTSPQLGGDLDTNSFNISFDDAHGITDENGNEQITFQTTSSAVNQFDVTNAATGNAPSISATGGDTNIDVALIPKGSGEIKVGTGSGNATVTSSGAHDLILDTNSGTNSGNITITDGSNGNITLTPNGTGDVVASADTLTVGDAGAAATIASNGAGTLTVTTGGATDLILNTNGGTDSGSIQITDAANGNIAITPNGSGNVVLDGLTFPNADGSADQVLKTDGSGTLSFTDASGGTQWQSSVKTADFTAVAGQGFWVNTASGDVVVTLPSSPSVGDIVELADFNRSWGTHSVTLNDNGSNFQGTGSSVPVYNENGQHVELIYSGSTNGWIPKLDSVVADKTETILRFLNLAGGGAGGANQGGGGGAGGIKLGTAVVTAGDVYQISIGGGGSGSPANNKGGSGSASTIRASNGGKIISLTTGGGGGGGRDSAATDGGCGGGNSTPSSTTANGKGTVGEGFDGGGGSTACGGGGTGEAGHKSGSPASAPGVSSQGGDGIVSGITGTSSNFGGGGGGATPSTAAANGGAGGGTRGELPSSSSTAAAANTGSGSGGTDGTGTSGAGGSGVVIFRVRTAAYPGTTTGSPTVTTDGEDTIIKFTGSGTYTA